MNTPTSFEEFWPDYLRAHANPLTRTLHLGGTAVGLGSVALAMVTRKPRIAVAGLASAYAAAWAGHLLVEGNVPKTFSNPLWSLRADLRMLRLALKGTLAAEAKRIGGDS